VDLVGPLPASPEGFSYIFMIIDRTTHWLEDVPLCSTATADIDEQLGDAVWPAGHYYFGQGCTVYIRAMERSHEEAGDQASNVNCFPPPKQQHGGEAATGPHTCPGCC
jgi:hypothetical protein